VTWPQDRARSGTSSTSAMSSVSTTPKTKFMLTDLNIDFPRGELTLVCGKLGSGKTLLLLGTYYFLSFMRQQHLSEDSTSRGSGFPYWSGPMSQDTTRRDSVLRRCRSSIR
jgi:excinuclease UvrABC ATPase subunit